MEYVPDKLAVDKAYDSNNLDAHFLDERDIEMIVPHRKGRKKLKTQQDMSTMLKIFWLHFSLGAQ